MITNDAEYIIVKTNTSNPKTCIYYTFMSTKQILCLHTLHSKTTEHEGKLSKSLQINTRMDYEKEDNVMNE